MESRVETKEAVPALEGFARLFPYQREDVTRITGRQKGRVLLALDVGLGKTAVALISAYVLDAYPILVVCPAGLRLNWQAEIGKWLPGVFGQDDVTVVRTGQDRIGGRVCIISYDLAASRIEELKRFRPKTLILDESHALKNPKSLRSKRIVPLCRAVPHCLLLTGTPMLNRPMELYPLLKALRIKGLPDRRGFGIRYCDGEQKVIGYNHRLKKPKTAWDFSGSSNLGELRQKLQPFMIRRRKADVLTDLPDRLRVRLTVDAEGRGDGELRQICREALAQTGGSVPVALRLLQSREIDVEGPLFRVYKELGESKAKVAAQWVVDNAGPENPIVAFAHHLAVIDHLVTAATDAGLRVGMITGAVSVDERQALADRMQSGGLDLLACGITAANSGLTLTRSRDLLMVEQPWSPQIALQCEGRVHRISQTRGVVCRYMVAAGTFDEILWRLLAKKARDARNVLDFDGPVGERFAADAEEGYWAVIEQMLHEMAA